MNKTIIDSIEYRETYIKDVFVSENGKVLRQYFSAKGERRIAFYKGEICKNGYCRVDISNTHYLIHRLVYSAWVGELVGGLVIDHIDANPKNNHYSNLRQVTQSENIRNAIVNGNFKTDKMARPLSVFDRLNNTRKLYSSVKSFLIDIKAPDYMIKHNALASLSKRKDYKDRFEITFIARY